MQDSKVHREEIVITTEVIQLANSQDDNCTENKDAEKSVMLNDVSVEKRQTLKERLKGDEEYRRKFLLWLSLCMSSFIMGWTIGQLGPSLLDLKEITNVSLDAASFFLTSLFVGYLIGTTSSGAVYQRINPYLLLMIGISLMAVTSAVIPWCSLYEIMIFMHILKGIGFGVLDTAGNSIFMSKFKDEKDIHSYMQTIHLMFAIGGFLSPIATAPFLMEYQTKNFNYTNGASNLSVHNQSILYMNVDQIISTMDNLTQSLESNDSERPEIFRYNETEHFNQIHSKLYQPYLLSTALCLVLVIPFVIICCKHRKLDKKAKSKDEKSQRKLPRLLKISSLILMCLFLGVDNGMEDTVFGLFSTFIVEELGWTKQNASYAISVYWASFALGRLCAIFIGPKFRSSKLLRYYIILFFLGLIGLLLSTVFTFHIGVWIFFPIMGFAVSVFFPAIFVWTEEDFMSVAGKVSSMLLLSASLGSMVNPIFIGYLMDHYDPMWFLYITIADGIALLVMVWTATYLSKYIRKYHKESEIRATELQEL